MAWTHDKVRVWVVANLAPGMGANRTESDEFRLLRSDDDVRLTRLRIVYDQAAIWRDVSRVANL